MTTFQTLLADVKTRILAIEPTATFNVSYYAIALGAQDDTTGLYAVSYAAPATIEMILVPKAEQRLLSGSGIYVSYSCIGLTGSVVTVGSEIKDASNNYYQIMNVQPQTVGDLIIYYTVQLQYLPLHGA